MDPATYLADNPLGVAVYERVRSTLEALGPVTVRTTRSQIAFRRARGFAWLWIPGRYLRNPGAEVVLSVALGRLDPSPRFKEVAHPSQRHWIHHLEVREVDAIDAEVRTWLQEAADRAG